MKLVLCVLPTPFLLHLPRRARPVYAGRRTLLVSHSWVDRQTLPLPLFESSALEMPGYLNRRDAYPSPVMRIQSRPED